MNTLRLRPVVLYRRATFLPLPYGSENEWKAETSADVSPATLLFFPFRPQPAAGGLADSRGILVANAAFDACERVGLPECELNLAHATLFLATAPKSNSATLALEAARGQIRSNEIQAVPLWLRDAHNSLNKKLGNGAAYIYNHDCPGHISGQEYMERPMKFYRPTSYGAEAQIARRLEEFKEFKRKANQCDKTTTT